MYFLTLIYSSVFRRIYQEHVGLLSRKCSIEHSNLLLYTNRIMSDTVNF